RLCPLYQGDLPVKFAGDYGIDFFAEGGIIEKERPPSGRSYENDKELPLLMRRFFLYLNLVA
ncbi:MAG: hypothetical protein LBS67_02230, partial [Clostridiales Family XIII bacterium]|nr:hypothetical protein [Clostridiales Family XIII bacterium]